ncbi:hypothetical protein COOONC_25628, partial [Cooperia oncophora]
MDNISFLNNNGGPIEILIKRETCSGDADEALKTMEKRKPNFMRFGRSVSFGKKGSDPNFLRFGRNQPNFLRFGKAA